MKVKLNKPAYYKGTQYNEGDEPIVTARVGSAWIQTGKANEISGKKAVRTSKRKSSGDTGGEDSSLGKDSGGDD